MPEQAASAVAAVRKSVTVPATPDRAFEGVYRPASATGGRLPPTQSAPIKPRGLSSVPGSAASSSKRWPTGRHRPGAPSPDGNPRNGWLSPGTPELRRPGSSLVVITFTPSGPASTLVELVHTGWENRQDGAAARAGYQAGWDPVIERYARAAAALTGWSAPPSSQPPPDDRRQLVDGVDAVLLGRVGRT